MLSIKINISFIGSMSLILYVLLYFLVLLLLLSLFFRLFYFYFLRLHRLLDKYSSTLSLSVSLIRFFTFISFAIFIFLHVRKLNLIYFSLKCKHVYDDALFRWQQRILQNVNNFNVARLIYVLLHVVVVAATLLSRSKERRKQFSLTLQKIK